MRLQNVAILAAFAAATILGWIALNPAHQELGWNGRITGISYSPYRSGQSPEGGPYPSVEEIDDRGRHHRTTRNKGERRGCPQGAPVSPLLSNLYMRRFILGWKSLGHQQRLGARIANYADDFVICCRGTAEEAMRAHIASVIEALRSLEAIGLT